MLGSERSGVAVRLASFLAALGVLTALAALTISTSAPRPSALLYDSVTLGPYGSYDPQTWWFHDEKAQEDNGMFQTPNTLYTQQGGGRLVPWTWEEAQYQPLNLGGNAEQSGSVVPYDVNDVIYQQPVEQINVD